MAIVQKAEKGRGVLELGYGSINFKSGAARKRGGNRVGDAGGGRDSQKDRSSLPGVKRRILSGKGYNSIGSNCSERAEPDRRP